MAFTGRGAQQIQRIEDELQKITVVIKRFLYINEESGFYLAACELPKDTPNVTAVVNGKVFESRKFVAEGTSSLVISGIGEGQLVDMYGSFEKGRSEDEVKFVVGSCEEKVPEKSSGLILFLGSGKIRGVGSKIAAKIAEKFGNKTIQVLDNEPERLKEVEGLNDKKIELIKEDWKSWRSKLEIISTLREYRITDASAIKIFDEFGAKSMDIIKNDPYKLTEVKGFGFDSADRIARAGGIEITDPMRVKMCIKYLLRKVADNGNTACPTAMLKKEGSKVLGVSEVMVEDYINELSENNEIISKQVKMRVGGNRLAPVYEMFDGFADSKVHFTELRIAKEIARIQFSPILNHDKEKINKFIKKNDFKLDESQLEASKSIFENKFSVLTGGPGTGKTHTTKAILSFYKSLGLKVVLAAPTGRAAQRMKEATGEESETIHSRLGYDGTGFSKNSENLLDGDVFLFDETSMLDIWIAKAVLSAIPDHARVLFIGDYDQLASVSAGAVLRDLIESEMVNVARLRELHRTGKNSNINFEARNVIDQKMPVLYDYKSDSDFVFVEANDDETIKETILDIVSELALNKDANLKASDIQILSPRKDTKVGVHNLNMELRPLLNPTYRMYQGVDFKYLPGDRVMQFKNDKDLKIYNGDVGIVTSINEEDGMAMVDFLGNKVEIEGSKLSNLNFAYASTVHKAQGSDYPIVIIPISSKHIHMWDANLLYTAITRGRQRVILVGEKRALQLSVSSYKQKYRITGLQEHLKEILAKDKGFKEDPLYEQWLIEEFETQIEQDITREIKKKCINK